MLQSLLLALIASFVIHVEDDTGWDQSRADEVLAKLIDQVAARAKRPVQLDLVRGSKACRTRLACSEEIRSRTNAAEVLLVRFERRADLLVLSVVRTGRDAPVEITFKDAKAADLAGLVKELVPEGADATPPIPTPGTTYAAPPPRPPPRPAPPPPKPSEPPSILFGGSDL